MADVETFAMNYTNDCETFDYDAWSLSVCSGFDPGASWHTHHLVILNFDVERIKEPDCCGIIALRLPTCPPEDIQIFDFPEIVADALIHGRLRFEYLSQPLFFGGDLQDAIDGTLITLCASTCRDQMHDDAGANQQ